MRHEIGEKEQKQVPDEAFRDTKSVKKNRNRFHEAFMRHEISEKEQK